MLAFAATRVGLFGYNRVEIKDNDFKRYNCAYHDKGIFWDVIEYEDEWTGSSKCLPIKRWHRYIRPVHLRINDKEIKGICWWL